ncbi:beta-eliminating lyase-related protein [Clostridium boliviensis]|uniref:Beta-eliminating lyase-related protein n=1 Tax=Clostridium boliviensis TaxID=318465 RepID=A0ABU4GP68_9CLOT|nr:beta-eliminating lyase-related protein [Clostridium boliviensis]MDW2799421.1 beta-eliminating lyase-related protein [Clostridium boliviensis]
MYSFNNDYSEGAHPKILEAMTRTNLVQNGGYGLDEHCTRAREIIRQETGSKDADVHFIVGGTQTNLITIATALRPWQAVICVAQGHINVHETGAIEATGHKVLAMPGKEGKLTPDEIIQAFEYHTDEHMVQPKMVYISNSTEIGTQYSKAELEALHRLCREKELYLFLDGARLGSALTSTVNDLSVKDIAALTDVFYIGGTKAGALFGEALVITHPDLKPDFRFMMKQRGALLAKGWLLGIQFEELFTDGLYYELASHANDMADILREGIRNMGYTFFSPSFTNQLFPIFPESVINTLQKEFIFSIQEKEEDRSVIRLVTSWATRQEECEHFLSVLKTCSM